MKKHNIESIYRLSPMQEGILFHTLESAKPGVYFEQYSCILEGDVEAERLKWAWDEVARRHTVLRTLFSWERRDRPLQIVREYVSLPWTEQDWRDIAASEQNLRWQSFLKRDRERGFELERAPLVRFALIRLAEKRYRFLWSFHHILLDGWSMRLLLDEVARFYQAYHDEQAASLEPAPSYGDYIAWFEQQDLAQAESYWTNILRGFDTPTLPASGALEGNVSGHDVAEVQRIDLSEEITSRLKALARREHLTLNTLILGAWTLVLSRYSGTNDVVFGATLSGRPVELENVEKIAGLFINTLPLRVRVPDCDGDPLISWLRGIQSRQLELRQFEHTPLVAVQRWSEVPPGTPLFETVIVFENFPARTAGGHTENLLQVCQETYIEYSNYPLAILAVPDDRLALIAVHDARRYGAAMVTRMLEHLKNALENMEDYVQRPVATAPIITEKERILILDKWNDTRNAFPENRCIYELIEACAERNPDSIAVMFEGVALTYGALNRSANQLACHLHRLGVGPDVAVPIFLERSADAIIAILAVLKAGGAYVPLDPTFPQQRLELVLHNLARAQTDGGLPAEARAVILTQERLLDRLPSSSFESLCIDWNSLELGESSSANPKSSNDPAQLAYIMFTSGSTGSPKGVMVTHRSLVNSTWARNACYPEPLTSFLLLSSLATDSSVAGIFWSLCSGATLVIPRVRIEQDVSQLSDLIAEQNVSHTLCVPSLYGLILEHCQPDKLAALKAVMVAGEACSRDVVQRHHAILPSVSLYNEYGPTESTVWATVAKLSDDHGDTPVSIGRPVSNLTAYILDSAMNPVPIGLPGELCIGGVGVALGYLNQPDQTEERFVSDPFSSVPGARLYKTGDLARYMPNGDIEFLGRIDNQVKIRGYRVELEEIERTLAGHPDVSEAVVMIAENEKTRRPAEDAQTKDLLVDPAALADALLALGDTEAERLLSEIERLSADEVARALQATRAAIPGASSQLIEGIRK